MGNENKKCPKTIHHGFHMVPCGRPVKGTADDGKELCGIHLNAWRKRQAAEKKFNEKRRELQRRNEESQAAKERADTLCKRAHDMQLSARPFTTNRSVYTGEIVVSEAEFSSLLDHIQELRDLARR